jgi:hypothetical protein
VRDFKIGKNIAYLAEFLEHSNCQGAVDH